jgi:hypothetical protein
LAFTAARRNASAGSIRPRSTGSIASRSRMSRPAYHHLADQVLDSPAARQAYRYDQWW